MSTLKNSGWIIADKILRAGSGLVITSILAKKIGVSEFGIFNIGIVFFTLAIPFSNMGLESFLINEFLKKDLKNEKEIIDTAIILRFISALAGVIVFTLISYLIYQNYAISFIVFIQTLCLLPLSIDVFESYFQAHHLSFLSFKARNLSFFILIIPKIALLYSNYFTIENFIYLNLLEFIFTTILLAKYYSYSPFDLSYSKVVAKKIVKISFPLILASFSVIIYMKIDQLMISYYCDFKEVGIYSAALKISEAWYFLPIAFLSSLYPNIIKLTQKDNSNELKKYISSSLTILTFISLIVSISIFFLSTFIVNIFYNYEFHSSAIIINIHIWTGIFICWGIVGNQILTSNDQNNTLLTKTILGLILNIILNLILIPSFKSQGAAYATLISQIYIGFFADYLNEKTRFLPMLKLKSTKFWEIYNSLNIVFNNKK